MASTLSILPNLFLTLKNPVAYISSMLGGGDTEYRTRSGITFRIRSRSTDRLTFREVWLERNYTPPGFGINRNDIVVDIGANIGMFSAFASGYSDKIYAFEPDKSNFGRLIENLKLNSIRNVSAFNCAVAAKTGKTRFFVHKDGTLNSLYRLRQDMREVSVDSITLQDFIEKEKIQEIGFLKMDCEGAEYDILMGCPPGVLAKVRVISLEYHPDPKGRGPESLRKFLESNGFSVTLSEKTSGFGMMYAKKA